MQLEAATRPDSCRELFDIQKFSQGGKTTITTGIIERIAEKDYRVCVKSNERVCTAETKLASLPPKGGLEGRPCKEALPVMVALELESVVH